MYDFDSKPVSLPHLRMVKNFAELIFPLGEKGQLDEKYHESWARHFFEMGVTDEETTKIGKWYVKHHTICPSISCVFRAKDYLRKHKTLPNQRIACDVEIRVGNVLRHLRNEGIDLSDSVYILTQAAALAQVANYNGDPSVERDYIKDEFEGVARSCDLFADDILREVRQGKGVLADLEDYLFED